jgi:hypothetical protein
MVVACWSAKGGSGTTVVAVALAVLAARSSPSGSLLVDLGGDAPVALGLGSPDGPGVLDWLAAPPEVGGDALDRLALDGADGVRVLPRGTGSGLPERLTAALVDRPHVVVDCGDRSDPVGSWVAATLPVSLLVVRPCSLALRRVERVPVRPTGVVVVDEPGHRIDIHHVADAAGAPVVARVPWDPAVARAVDSGTLGARVPRSLARSLRGLL